MKQVPAVYERERMVRNGGDAFKPYVPRAIRTEKILGDYRYEKVVEDFWFYSGILRMWCCIPAGFIYDNESVPFLKGTNPEAGGIHDYLSRKNSVPVVAKQVAADVYREFQEYFDEMESGNEFNRCWDWIRRTVKIGFVRTWPGYWHTFTVEATYKEITG